MNRAREVESHNPNMKRKIAKLLAEVLKKNEGQFLYNKKLVLRVVKDCLWAATELANDGRLVKYKEEQLWTEDAVKRYNENKKTNIRPNDKGLRHEHSVPLKVLKALLLKQDKPSEDSICEILDKYAHAVIVTKEEDSKINKYKEERLKDSMPEGWDEKDVFARYKKVGIEPQQVTQQDFL